MKTIALVLLAVWTWLLAGCGPGAGVPTAQPYTPERVSPAAEVRLGADQTIGVALGFGNESEQPIAATDDLAGEWVLIDSAGQVRARGEILTAGPLAPRETSYPLVWHAALEPGTYTLRWGAPAIGTLVAEVTVSGDGAGVGMGRQEVFDDFRVD